MLKTLEDNDESILSIINGCILEGNCLALTGDAI